MDASGMAGKYELRDVIGRGAAGVVYEGFDPILARKVAIKTLPLELSDDEAREQYARFQQEAQAAARLHHPNIVPVFDYGETATHAYIVMEHLPGGSLKARMDGARMDVHAVLNVMSGILAGLQHSHMRGVVHRDVKPANIVFDDAGEPKITDFGIARLETSKLTIAGTLLGTPAYMSPEQVLGEPADLRSDLYSAGVILYELLTGQRPFEGSASSIMHKIVHAPPPRPSELPAPAPARFDAVIARALAKAPEDRFQTAAEFSRALREDDMTMPLGQQAARALPTNGFAPPAQTPGPAAAPVAFEPLASLSIVSAPPGVPVALQPMRVVGPPRFSPAVLGGIGLAVLLIVGGAAWGLLGGPRHDPPPPGPPTPHQDAALTAPVNPLPETARSNSGPVPTPPPAPIAAPVAPPTAPPQPSPAAAPNAPPQPPPAAAAPPQPGPVAALVVPPPSAPVVASSAPAPQAPTAAEFRDCEHCPTMVPIHAGNFAMGSNDDPSEAPSHQVAIPPFAIGKFPVTVAEWGSCAAAGACAATPPDAASDAARTPMANVSWKDASDYAAWLRKTTGKPYRLPSESEWEYAARGGAALRYWWGNQPEIGHADCNGCGGKQDARPALTDAYPANPWGLYGVAGGVAEWVDDCWHVSYRTFEMAPADGSPWRFALCTRHVLRGGSWMSQPAGVTVSARGVGEDGAANAANGVRVALSMP